MEKIRRRLMCLYGKNQKVEQEDAATDAAEGHVAQRVGPHAEFLYPDWPSKEGHRLHRNGQAVCHGAEQALSYTMGELIILASSSKDKSICTCMRVFMVSCIGSIDQDYKYVRTFTLGFMLLFWWCLVTKPRK
jgi:hypothetical protein